MRETFTGKEVRLREGTWTREYGEPLQRPLLAGDTRNYESAPFESRWVGLWGGIGIGLAFVFWQVPRVLVGVPLRFALVASWQIFVHVAAEFGAMAVRYRANHGGSTDRLIGARFGRLGDVYSIHATCVGNDSLPGSAAAALGHGVERADVVVRGEP